jgi:hypothetical protein
MSTNLEELMNQYQDQTMDILFLVLKNGDLSPDVKTIGIQAIGDICLMAETNFLPKLLESMSLLIEAGKICLSTDTSALQSDEAKNIHDMRNALIDAFTSMINGIKSPDDSKTLSIENL